MKLRKSREALLFFILGIVFPPLAVLLLLVVLPVIRNSLSGGEESSIAYRKTKSSVSEANTMRKLSLPRAKTTHTDSAQAEDVQRKNALEIEQAFLQARLKLAQTNAVYLVIDLVDNAVSLEIKGVEVRRCKILRFNISSEDEYMRKIGILSDWLSTPFVLQQERATIPKEPIRVKEAPKDAAEADLQVDKNIPVENSIVKFSLYFDRNFLISVKEAQPPSFGNRFRNVFYKAGERFQSETVNLGFLLRFKKPQNRVQISLELSREDAKAVYRALPNNAGLALRI
jgi:hypothetical protein